ncbi:CDK5 regulatory subunit-associated protein 3-like isoform X1 [Mercenaria mercenaria]|uniref:CDK5 regulatory subunit-associated protein 3-like isoform X1 n=1 Tax=Mercenaria mercenaria TaxID=6596 RepID=UPI00234EF85B|nr:CDK5 regulatory subunit-associated protein 3-like isoform X1 [Mercenaria mercenaria]
MQQDVENLPIDIHFNKLLDWLIDRRHCKQQWQAASLIVREKINAALKDMPENEELAKLLEGTYINYFHCEKIVEILKGTSAGEKNIFGQYSSQKMKDWNDIIRIYEKDCMFLAETAQMIMRNVTYEIPALKKQIAKCQQVQKECDKKEADYVSKAAELKKKYSNSCKELGIKGDKIKSELAALVQDLPKVFDDVATRTQQLTVALKYYQDFRSFLLNSDVQDSDCLPMLRFIQQKGNTVTYEWKHGCKPVHIQEASVVIDTKDEDDVVVEDGADIDWGDLNGNTNEVNVDAEIDFDISGITIESGGTDEGKGAIDIEVEQLGEEIDWGDTEVESTQKSSVSDEGTATGEEALTILDNPATRNLFLDDLVELEAFLNQRLVDLSGEGNILASSQFQNAPASIQIEAKQVETMATDLRNIIAQLTSVQNQHLMLIRDSPRYVERLKDTLKSTLTLADKMIFYQKETISRRHDMEKEERELLPKLEVLVKRTKEMQKQMEGEISKRYKNRPVNIMGEINII